MGDRYSGRSPPRRGPPPRDRPPARDRDRDDHPDVEYFGAGESYRPGGQTGDGPYRPVRERERENDRWNPAGRDERRDRDDRRDERRRDDIDSYIPPTSVRAQRRSRSPPPYRKRSRSPPPARAPGRTELFPDRAAARSPPPPPRRYSPPRDRPRSPIRRRSRSPYTARGRSPEIKRPRDHSPPRRSPKRGRLDSPPRRYDDRIRSPPRRPMSPDRNTYRPRSRTPPRRDDRRPNFADESWRRRSPSPRDSAATSRRSSPPLHLDRASLAGSRTHSPVRDRPRYDGRRDDTYRAPPRSPPPNDYTDRDRDRARSRDGYQSQPTSTAPPTGPRAGAHSRAPPSGPSRGASYAATSPPTGPSNSISAHNRPSAFVSPAPPSGPRGAAVPPRDFTSPPGAMRGRTSLTYRAPGYRPPIPSPSSFDAPVVPPGPSPTPPSGPRASSYSSRGDFASSAGRGGFPSGPRSASQSYNSNTEYPFRPAMNTSSTSTTYPRSQRFNATGPPTGPSSVTTTFNNGPTSHTASPVTPATPASFVKSQLNTLERVVPGGRKMPGSSGMSTDQERRVKQLEEDAERIRADLNEKQRMKRETLREWEVRERESEIAGLKSQLADDHLRVLGEEDSVMMGAAF